MAPGAVSPPTTPSKATWANGVEKASKNVAWYQANLSRVPGTALEILREYSGIPENEILKHVGEVRDKAWDM